MALIKLFSGVQFFSILVLKCRRISIPVVLALSFSVSANITFAQGTFTAIANGAWTTPGTWSFTGTPTLSFPTALDNVTIGGSFIVNLTVPAACNNLTMDVKGLLNGANTL